MKIRKKGSIDKDILRKYFLTYFIVLFIPLVICCSYYIRMLYVISEDDIREKKTELLHSAELVDSFMEELDSFSGMLAGSPAVNIFRFQDKVLEFPVERRRTIRQSLPEQHMESRPENGT